MMSIAQVRSAGSAGNYYTDKDNYYVLGSMGERWAGRGAEQLGLQGSVDKDVFTRLLEGRLPDGADLSRMQDGSNKHRPGYDLTFSAPKSVSMMAMLGGDKRLIDAHNQAVDFAVRQVEALASTRVMTDGQSETVLTGNLVMALFNHDTSRDQEPQLHTHAVVSGLESVKPSQVPRLEGAWAPEHSVTEFSHSQEAKLAEAQQKAMQNGEAFPDVPMTLYEAIVRDYTGRTPEAREQTLIVTHLNEDRRVLNSMIHDAREKAGELGKEQVMVPVLNTANIRDGELRRLSTWENNPDALALVDNVYHRIAGIGKDDGLITLEDAEGNTRLISPREAVAEGVTLYTPDTIRVGTGDRMRFTKSDRERGYVANSVWTVTAVSGDSVTLSDGQQTRVIRPGQEQAEQHIDLAYAITAHGAQGASETFAIALEGTEGNRKLMAGFESAYVALSRMKQHVQVYTDNRPLTGCGDGGLLLSSHIIWQAFPGMRGISCLPLQWRHRC